MADSSISRWTASKSWTLVAIPFFENFETELFDLRQRKGWTLAKPSASFSSRYVFGAMLVRDGLVDGQVHGIAQILPQRHPAGAAGDSPAAGCCTRCPGLYLMISKNRTLLFADTTVNIDPSAEDLAEIALLAAEMALFFDMPPRVAMLSFSNFGSVAPPRGPKGRRGRRSPGAASRS